MSRRHRKGLIKRPLVNPYGTSGGTGGQDSADWWWQQAEFILPLNDLGAGAVNTTLAQGTGPATFTRATTAWTKLSTGLWASVASGVARSCYIGLNTVASTAYGGYLAEGAGTQLVTPTASIRDMTNAAWVKVNMTTAKTATGIDGVANSATTLTSAGGGSSALQTLVAAASTRTYSAWIKRRTGTGQILLTQNTFTNSTDITSLINSSTYTLIQLSESRLNAAFGIGILTDGDAIDVDFNQFEAGAFATSPMDAAGAVRNADVLTYTFAGNASTANGSAYAEISRLAGVGTNAGAVLSFDSGPNGQVITQASGQATTTITIYDGTGQVNKTGLEDSTTGSRKVASSFGAAGLAVTGSGLAVATGSFDGAMGDGTSIFVNILGANSTPLVGTSKNIRIWQRQLPNAVLSAITV